METIELISTEGEDVRIKLVSTSSQDVVLVIDEADALAEAEAMYQLSEGGNYEFEIDKGYYLREIPGVVSNSKLNRQIGRITPNIYVGTLPIAILKTSTNEKVSELRLEIRSIKTSYREDYRRMLEEIAEKCTDLLMQHSSPVVQTFTVDLEKDSETAYQRFAFIKSVIDSQEFESAVHKILSGPTTKWKQTIVDKPIQAVRGLNRKTIRQFASSSQRVKTPPDHSLYNIIKSLPERVQVAIKEETVDTPENRFIKFALENFLRLCSDFSHLEQGSRIKTEATLLEERLERHLSHAVFSEISVLSTVPLNNPVLQRKEGYREIYRTWILFDLAAKLTWKGGDDVYDGNKRDVAVLYEYWLFFKLIEIVTDVFNLKSPDPEALLEETSDGFGLKLKQGEYLPIKGVSEIGSRKLYVQLSYNRTYKGDQEYPKAGSWSRNLRPDYTLTIWPHGIDEDQAEKEELIVHIHFDAKYKVEKFREIFSDEVQLDEEKEEQRNGTYKRVDLLKMHAYKDAIRRTAGAYVLYPGEDKPKPKKGFHEIVPGLGAFAIRPSRIDNGLEDLKGFLKDVTMHLLNRASQREKISYQHFDIYNKEAANEIRENLPEAYGVNRSFIPSEVFVLVGFYKDEQHFKWIRKNKLYNARTGSKRGSLHLRPEETGASYLLLHSAGETVANKFFKLKKSGPRIFSQKDMLNKGYEEPKEFYLVFEIEGEAEKEFNNVTWNISKLKEYSGGRGSSLPFAVTISELMDVIDKKI